MKWAGLLFIVALATWDDQADVEDPEEDLPLASLAVLHGMVRLIRWLLRIRFLRWIRWIRLDGHRPDTRRICERLMNG